MKLVLDGWVNYDSHETREDVEVDGLIFDAVYEMSGFGIVETAAILDMQHNNIIVWVLGDISRKGRAW